MPIWRANLVLLISVTICLLCNNAGVSAFQLGSDWSGFDDLVMPSDTNEASATVTTATSARSAAGQTKTTLTAETASSTKDSKLSTKSADATTSFASSTTSSTILVSKKSSTSGSGRVETSKTVVPETTTTSTTKTKVPTTEPVANSTTAPKVTDSKLSILSKSMRTALPQKVPPILSSTPTPKQQDQQPPEQPPPAVLAKESKFELISIEQSQVELSIGGLGAPGEAGMFTWLMVLLLLLISTVAWIWFCCVR